MTGLFGDPLNPQHEHAETLLELVTVALSDGRYVARLERHCAMVKEAAVDPSHPAYRRLARLETGSARSAPPAQRSVSMREREKVQALP